MSGSHDNRVNVLFKAIKSKDLSRLQAVVESLGDEKMWVLNSHDLRGSAPLVEASYLKQLGMVEYLFDQGAKADQTSIIKNNPNPISAFKYLCRNAHALSLVRKLLDSLPRVRAAELLSVDATCLTPLYSAIITCGRRLMRHVSADDGSHVPVERKMSAEMLDYLLSFPLKIDRVSLKAAIYERSMLLVRRFLCMISAKNLNSICIAQDGSHENLLFFVAKMTITRHAIEHCPDPINNSFKIFMLLLRAGVDLRFANGRARHGGENAIHLILSTQNMGYLQVLCEFIATLPKPERQTILNYPDPVY